MWFLEVNDRLLQLSTPEKVYYSEPGVASLDRKKGDVFGDAAFAQLFELPRQRLSTAWQAMNQDVCLQRGKDIRTNSDAISNQLEAMFKETRKEIGDEGWLLVPGDLSETQLGLLYGILNYVDLKPLGFLDSAAMVAAQPSIPAKVSFVELYLHRTVITHLEKHSENELTAVRSTTLTQTGYLEFIERWLHRLANRFLDSSRFDLHVTGMTEQQAVNQLIGANLGDSSTHIEIEYKDQLNQLAIPREELAESCSDFYERIAQACASTENVVLGKHASELPDIESFFIEKGLQVDTINDHSLTATLAELTQALPDSEQVNLHKTFPVAHSDLKGQQTKEANSATEVVEQPTHLLEESIARPMPFGQTDDLKINGDCLCLVEKTEHQVSVSPVGIGTVKLNDQIVEKPTLISNGDSLTIYTDEGLTREFLFINVVERG